jgi:aminoglycoside phosphotransferase (APT) family kinase protein
VASAAATGDRRRLSSDAAAEAVASAGGGRAVRVKPLPSRGAAFLVETEERCFFVKAPAEDGVEARACALAHTVRVRGGEPVAPALLDDGGVQIVLEGLAGWSSLDELFERGTSRELELAAAAGFALARLHAAPVPELPEAPAPLACVDELDPDEAAALPGESLELIAELQSTPRLLGELDELRRRPAARTFVHGDVKLDNILAPDDGRAVVRFVDWERAGAGDPALDLGALAGDYLFRWLRSVEPARGRPLLEWLAGARVPRTRAAAAVSAALDGYEGGGGVVDEVAVTQFAGLHLLGRAQAWIDVYGEYSARAHVLVHVGRRLVLEPERAARGLAT